MIDRPLYIDQLKSLIDAPLVKIITGIRRSGKSTILRLLKEYLLERGIQPERIVFINLESFQFSEIDSASKLYEYVSACCVPGVKNYILLDEIQDVPEWEKAINSLLTDFQVDIYITGSNAHLLSTELATYLAGRYVEIPVYTLSFSEFKQFRSTYLKEGTTVTDRELLNTYIRLGGFPVIHIAPYNTETAYRIIYDIYSSVILRDTIHRYKIREVELLERVVKYVFDNIGNTFSGKKVADYFKSQQRKIDLNTVYNYLHALEGALIIHRISRYDIKGKEILKTQEKFYLSDSSLLYATMGYRDRLIAGVMENLIFLELKRKGYDVFIGKLDDKEIDFIAEKPGEKVYIQVAYKLEDQKTIEREFSSLLSIDDQYPKFVISMDDFWKESIMGVRHIHLADFLTTDFI